MFSVGIKTKNTFYELGLFSLLKKIFNEEGNEDYSFVSILEAKSESKVNVIFKDCMVIVNIYHNDRFILRDPSDNSKPVMTINIPFNSGQLEIYDMMSKIKKVLSIARLTCRNTLSEDIFRRLRLKHHIQLSTTETKVVELTGQGHSIGGISKILERSEKTILTHRRNAIRKMGVLNRLEFYHYALHMQNHSNKDAVFICV